MAMSEEETTSQNRSFLQMIFITPGEPRLRSGWRLLGQALFLLIALAILGLLQYFLTFTFDSLSLRADLLFSAILLSAAVTVSIFISRRYLDKRTFMSLGVQIDQQTLPDIIFGVAISGLLIGLIFLVELVVGWLQIESFAWTGESWLDIVASFIIMLAVFALGSWAEELLARGYWLQNISDGSNLSLAVLFSSVLFALIHAYNSNVSWLAYLGLFLSGVFLAFCYLRTRNLWLPIGFHLGWNFFEGVVFGFPVSGAYFYQLIRQTIVGPDIITGGAFGPEGGLILIPILLLGIGLVFLYTKSRKLGVISSG